MSYYQKYRSEKVADLDLVSVRSAFETMMGSGKIAHAYLFVGPRGLGKTSAARILARLVNCENNYHGGKLKKLLGDPCGACEACVSIKKGSAVDVMEIDAASHRGIDDIRDLREKVNLAPGMLPKKVYIIDEVHMLTTEAFNALLKTLEEPPAHAMFILCTTEAHKVPETIISRCVKVNFTKATVEELMASLRRAAKGEGLKIEDEALRELALGLDGSFREGHKLLEQLANRSEKITVESVRELLKLAGGSQIESLLEAVRDGEVKVAVELIAGLEDEGVEVVNLVTKLLARLRQDMRAAAGEGRSISKADLRLTRKLIKAAGKIKISPLPMLPLEMVLVGEALKNKNPGVENNKPERVVVESVKKGRTVSETKPETAEGGVDGPGLKANFDQVVAGWHDLLARLQPRNHSVAGLLRSARPKEMGDKFLTLEVFYKFHKDQLEQEARRRIIEEEIAKLWGPISVRCVLGDPHARNAAGGQVKTVAVAVPGNVSDEVAAAEEVFGV